MATSADHVSATDDVSQGRTAVGANRILILLFLANLLNFFDRVIPAVVTEPIKNEFGLSDTQVGLMTSMFTIVYALAGIPLGRLADQGTRRTIISVGLGVWSILTAVTGLAWNYTSMLLIRMGVGIGEASYAPAATALISDLYPAHKRSRAVGTFMLGLPLGLLLAFFTIGTIVETFDTWRAPFFIAAVPGLILAFFLGRIKEPEKGASEPGGVPPATQPISVGAAITAIAKIPTIWALTLGFAAYQVASYAVNSFTVPLMMRYFGLELGAASMAVGVIVGLTGLLGLTIGARLSDTASRTSPRHRVLLGAVTLLVATPLAVVAFQLDRSATGLFIVVMGVAWLLAYLFYTSCYPALADVVIPQVRATAMALLFAIGYLLGGFGGPLLAGAMSDRFAASAAKADGVDIATLDPDKVAPYVAEGLHSSLAVIVPVSLGAAGLFLLLASLTILKDHKAAQTATSA